LKFGKGGGRKDKMVSEFQGLRKVSGEWKRPTVFFLETWNGFRVKSSPVISS
jgi:hypothetical protein